MTLPSIQPGISGDSINDIFKNSHSKLHKAVNNGDLETVTTLLTQSPSPARLINDFIVSGYNAVGLACYQGHTDVLRELVKFGGDLLRVGGDNRTPLFNAACGAHHLTVAYILCTIKTSFAEVPPADEQAMQNYMNQPNGINGDTLSAAYRAAAELDFRAATVGLLMDNGAKPPAGFMEKRAEELYSHYQKMLEDAYCTPALST